MHAVIVKNKILCSLFLCQNVLCIPPSSGQSTQDIILKGHCLKALRNPVQTSPFQIAGILKKSSVIKLYFEY